MAGLWTAWRDPKEPSSPWLITCAVLTTDAFGPLAEIHERMPLVLPRESFERWLAPDLGSDDVAELLKPSAEIVSRFELRPVSTAVNSIRNNGPSLLAPPEAEPVELDLFS
jgi:putative SOS response-associated peptidase YedK